MPKTFASASCPECQTDFDRLPVEYDEDGGYAVLPVRPCAYYYCVRKNKTDVECFRGTIFCAKPTGKAPCGIHGWLGESRRAR